MTRPPKSTNPVLETIRRNLNAFIEQSGYSQNQVADMSGIPQASFGRYLRGDHAIPVDYIPILSVVFGVDPGDFYAAKPPSVNIDGACPVLFKSRPGAELDADDWKDIEEIQSRMMARRAKKTAKKK